MRASRFDSILYASYGFYINGQFPLLPWLYPPPGTTFDLRRMRRLSYRAAVCAGAYAEKSFTDTSNNTVFCTAGGSEAIQVLIHVLTSAA
jgi:hypothetical protein